VNRGWGRGANGWPVMVLSNVFHLVGWDVVRLKLPLRAITLALRVSRSRLRGKVQRSAQGEGEWVVTKKAVGRVGRGTHPESVSVEDLLWLVEANDLLRSSKALSTRGWVEE